MKDLFDIMPYIVVVGASYAFWQALILPRILEKRRLKDEEHRRSLADQPPYCYYDLCCNVAKYLGYVEYDNSKPRCAIHHYIYYDEKLRISCDTEFKYGLYVCLQNCSEPENYEFVLEMRRRDVIDLTEPKTYRPEKTVQWEWETYLLQTLKPRLEEERKRRQMIKDAVEREEQPPYDY